MITLLMIAALAGPTPQYTFQDGNDLHQHCNTDVAGNIAGPLACSYYVQGAIDAQMATQGVGGKKLICMPGPIPTRQARDIVSKYLRNNPEGRAESAASLVIVAMANAFPCSQN